MASAQIGPLTEVFEAVAAAVGAGVVLGGFSAGICRLTMGQPRAEIEAKVLADGYLGGLVGVFVVCLDLILRYAP
jgi:hypothetical protein